MATQSEPPAGFRTDEIPPFGSNLVELEDADPFTPQALSQRRYSCCLLQLIYDATDLGSALQVGSSSKKDATQIIGCVRFDDGSWETTGHRMKETLEAALLRHPVQAWSQVRQLARDRLLRTVESGSAPLVAQLAAY